MAEVTHVPADFGQCVISECEFGIACHRLIEILFCLNKALRGSFVHLRMALQIKLVRQQILRRFPPDAPADKHAVPNLLGDAREFSRDGLSDAVVQFE